MNLQRFCKKLIEDEQFFIWYHTQLAQPDKLNIILYDWELDEILDEYIRQYKEKHPDELNNKLEKIYSEYHNSKVIAEQMIKKIPEQDKDRLKEEIEKTIIINNPAQENKQNG